MNDVVVSEFKSIIKLLASTLDDQQIPEVDREGLAAAVRTLVETWRSERERFYRSGVAPLN